MTYVNHILQLLQTLAPVSLAMDWDNVGLLCGSKNTPVTKVLVALDPFEDVVQEAAELGAELIVTHHPLIFRPLSAVTDETATGRAVQLLCRQGISAINAHTNLDCASGGVNDVLAQVLGLSAVTAIPDGDSGVCLLRQGQVAEMPLAEFLSQVKAKLGCPGLRYVDAGKPVRQVAVGGGACAGELALAAKVGCDTFVTADVKYNQFWDARELGVNLIDAGHFWTENPVVAVLAQAIQAAFPALEVKISQVHQDCMKFF